MFCGRCGKNTFSHHCICCGKKMWKWGNVGWGSDNSNGEAAQSHKSLRLKERSDDVRGCQEWKWDGTN